MEHAIVLKPETLGFLNVNIASFAYQNLPITNTLLVSWIVMAVLIIISFIVTWRIKIIPGFLQNIFEMVIGGAYDLVKDLSGEKKAIVFFPICMTFFLYIIFSNWLGLLPGFGTITYKGEPFLRSINSDLNMTLALALLSAALTHIFAIYYLGFSGYLKRWFSLQLFPVFLFVGFLEVISEITKIISLSFRLFGNIFAGEVVLSTVSSIFAFVVPLPFYFLEIIVGFVQAAVFMMLTLVFMVILSEKHEASHG